MTVSTAVTGFQNLTANGLGKVKLATVENLTGSAFNDVLRGSDSGAVQEQFVTVGKRISDRLYVYFEQGLRNTATLLRLESITGENIRVDSGRHLAGSGPADQGSART